MTISLKLMDEFDADMAGIAPVGKTVRSAREAVGYSIDQLAVTCGLSHDEITAVEAGLDADPARLKRIAAALQIPIASLIEGQA